MLAYNEIKERKYIVLDGAPYEVVYSHVARKQQNKPQNKTKLRNLISGSVVEHTFHVSDTADEADITKRGLEFIYRKGDEVWFNNEGKPSERFSLPVAILGGKEKYLETKMRVDAIVFTNDDDEEQIIGISLPIKMDFEVVDCPPSIKGNTATGGNKIVTLSSGATISAPLFINKGDIIKINTETDEYVERAGKK